MEKVAIEQRLKAEAAARESGSTTVDETTATLLADGAPGGTAVTLEKFSLRKAREARMLESQRFKEQENDGPASSSPGQESPSKAVRFSPVVQEKEFASDSAILRLPGPATEAQETSQEESVLYNEEHLQLSNEEAFFLAYGLGVLHVYDHQQKAIIPPTSLLSLFCHNSYYPPRDSSTDLKPDDPFMISYIVYHHFRSLGWVVRSGVKFGVDYLLYNRGPVFSHAEFAVVVIPAYEHSYWSETSDRKSYCATKQARSWWWLHCVNRVQAQVKKSLVVCYVEVPPPRSQDTENYSEDIGAILSRYKVREMLIRRWVPNRMRD
jgi:tRNA-splicing endonuclease subunit Sen2